MLLFEKIALLEKQAGSYEDDLDAAEQADEIKKSRKQLEKELADLKKKEDKINTKSEGRKKIDKLHGVVELGDGQRVPLKDYELTKRDLSPASVEGDLYGKRFGNHFVNKNTPAARYHNGIVAATHGITSIPNKLIGLAQNGIYDLLHERRQNKIRDLEKQKTLIETASRIRRLQAQGDMDKAILEHVRGVNGKLTAGMLGVAGLIGAAGLLASKSGSGGGSNSQPALSSPLQYESDYYH